MSVKRFSVQLKYLAVDLPNRYHIIWFDFNLWPFGRQIITAVKENVVKVGVSKFALNMEKHNKESLKNLDSENVFKRKDKGNQYTIHLNTTSYFIIVKSIAMLRGRYGMTVKRIDVDKKGNGTKEQYDVSVTVGQIIVTITMICYHTNNNMQIQLKGSQVEKIWGVKVQAFEWFVDVILRQMIIKVETLGNTLS